MFRKATPFLASSLAVSAIVAAVACSSNPPAVATVEGDAGGSESDGAPPPPFQADPPSVYVAKVKDVLVGLPPTDEEVATVEANPEQLGALVDGWMQLPQYQQKMLRFFELAFQQTQISAVDFTDQVTPRQFGFNGTTIPQITQNAQESFARTMLQLLAQGAPLTAGMNTQQFMMTTATKELYAFLDSWEVDDNGTATDHFKQAYPHADITVTSKGPIPLEESVDPTSPNFMHWYDPDVPVAWAQLPECQTEAVVFPSSGMTLQYLLYGTLDGRKSASGVSCPVFGGSAAAPQLQPGDFNDWKMVTVRAPHAGEEVTRFWDLPALRTAGELVLHVPRVGFFSTPAFFANWQTNTSNQSRVTAHQALIVATGSSIDGTDTTTPPGLPGLDQAHATGVACYTCHKILDPTRSIFSATYSWNFHTQLDPTWSGQPGVFAFRGVIQPVHSMLDFGNALASHPLLASGWAQKLCYYVNSAPCAQPDLDQLAGLFQASGYSWAALVKALVTSPVTTNAAPTATSAANGEVVAVARRDHLCAAINARLGYPDVCGLQATSPKGDGIAEIVPGLPSDAYGRGAPVPILPSQPTLFFRAATENICSTIAAQVVDPTGAPPGVKSWSSGQPNGAIADFVGLVMGLSASDPRTPQATSLLQSHFASAMQTGASATIALRSTFVVACLAPSAVSVGM